MTDLTMIIGRAFLFIVLWALLVFAGVSASDHLSGSTLISAQSQQTRSSLDFSQIKDFLTRKIDDETISNEMRNRDLAFCIDGKVKEKIRALGAGPKVLRTLDTMKKCPSRLNSFEFKTIKVDEKGAKTSEDELLGFSFSEDLGNGVKLEMVKIPEGKFMMGNSREAAEMDRKELQRHEKSEHFKILEDWALREMPQHKVELPQFFMGMMEVTQAQWRAVANLKKVRLDLNAAPSKFKGDDLPVENVSWEEAMEFCARLSQKTGLIFRLPSEAEWEYACRAGTTTPFHFGETITAEIVNYDGCCPYGAGPTGKDRAQTMPVGSLKYANRFGLYDMHGSVREWCLDDWDFANYDSAYSDGRPRKVESTKYRPVRGGSWERFAVYSRSASRDAEFFDERLHDVGFRVVCLSLPDQR